MVFTWHYRYRHHHTVGYGVVVSSRWWEQRQRRRALPVQCVSMEWSAAGIIIIIQKYHAIKQRNIIINIINIIIIKNGHQQSSVVVHLSGRNTASSGEMSHARRASSRYCFSEMLWLRHAVMSSSRGISRSERDRGLYHVTSLSTSFA